MSNINLSQDQHRLIDMYISQYNLVNSQINRLYDMLDDIRYNIQNTININNRNYRNTYRTPRTSNTFLNRYIDNLINEERQNNSVFYDYANPINPSIYSNIRSQTNNRSHNNIRSQTNNRGQNNTDVSTFLANFLNTNVIVRPTNEQIDNASRIIRYGDIENPLSESCPISLEHFNNDDMIRQIIHCGHIFCQTSFQTWFNSNVRCPVCRYDIRNYRSSPTVNTPSNNVPTNNNVPSNNTEEDNNPFSNFNVVRNPETNQIDQIAFDITNNLLSNELISNITSRMFESILQPNNNERLIFDPSHNVLLYETIISNASPINSSNRGNNRGNNRSNDNDSDSENEYSNIV